MREQATSSDAWYRALLDRSFDGVLVLDDDGHCVDANARICRLVEVPRGALLGASIRDFILPERLEAANGDDVRALRDAGVLTGQGALRTARGRPLQIEWQSSFDVVPGRHLCVAHVVPDEEERRQLSVDAHRLAAVVDSSDDAITSTDLDGVILSWNHAAERIFGYSAEEMIGQRLTELVPEDRRGEEAELTARVRRGDQVDHHATVRRHKDGSLLDVIVTISPVRDAHGDIVGASSVVRDVGREKDLRGELEQRLHELAEADRRKDQFLAMLAHELRNPLGAMSNAVYVLQPSHGSEAMRHRAVEVLRRQVQHQARIVNELLDVSRITRGLIELHFEEIDLAQLVRETIEDHRVASEHERIELRVDLPRRPLRVKADPTRMAQVVSNLLSNAFKFTDPGGEVTVTLRANDEEPPQAELIIDDTGIGIEPELLPHVFESFSHGDRTLARSRGGLGLGLAIVKGLVELHGGQVEVQSDGPGRGATICVELPLLAGAAVTSKPDRKVSAARGLRVLVVEDHPDAAETLKDLLEIHGHEVRVAYTGGEGVRMAREHHPDVILCDLGLPGMDGFEVAAALRTAPGGAPQRLVAVTGYGQDEDRRRTRAAGFHHHLVKPIDPDELRELLSGVVVDGDTPPA